MTTTWVARMWVAPGVAAVESAESFPAMTALKSQDFDISSKSGVLDLRNKQIGQSEEWKPPRTKKPKTRGSPDPVHVEKEEAATMMQRLDRSDSTAPGQGGTAGALLALCKCGGGATKTGPKGGGLPEAPRDNSSTHHNAASFIGATTKNLEAKILSLRRLRPFQHQIYSGVNSLV